jgi:hypothetical protein
VHLTDGAPLIEKTDPVRPHRTAGGGCMAGSVVTSTELFTQIGVCFGAHRAPAKYRQNTRKIPVKNDKQCLKIIKMTLKVVIDSHRQNDAFLPTDSLRETPQPMQPNGTKVNPIAQT